MNAQAESRLFSVGKMVERLQRAPAEIERAATELGLKPALELNGVRYFDVQAETTIQRSLRHGGRMDAGRSDHIRPAVCLDGRTETTSGGTEHF